MYITVVWAESNELTASLYLVRGHIYSAIHKAAVQPAAVQNGVWGTFCTAAPTDSQWTLFCPTGIIPGKPVEQP